MVRGCSSGCSCLVDVRVHVSDPRGIQFALSSCYALHIKALSIIMKVYTERKNMQVELIRFRKISYLFTFTFVNRGIQCESGVYAWIVVTT